MQPSGVDVSNKCWFFFIITRREWPFYVHCLPDIGVQDRALSHSTVALRMRAHVMVFNVSLFFCSVCVCVSLLFSNTFFIARFMVNSRHRRHRLRHPVCSSQVQIKINKATATATATIKCRKLFKRNMNHPQAKFNSMDKELMSSSSSSATIWRLFPFHCVLLRLQFCKVMRLFSCCFYSIQNKFSVHCLPISRFSFYFLLLSICHNSSGTSTATASNSNNG